MQLKLELSASISLKFIQGFFGNARHDLMWCFDIALAQLFIRDRRVGDEECSYAVCAHASMCMRDPSGLSA